MKNYIRSVDVNKLFIEKFLYPIMEKCKGNRIRHNIQELKVLQSMSNNSLLNYQKEKLRILLLECIKNVPAYKDYSNLKDEIEFNALNSISKFKILDKIDFTKNFNTYLNNCVLKPNLISNCTGGSTGEPFKFYIDRYTVEYYEAARWRGLSWWGITPGSRSVMIWGNPLELNKTAQRKFYLKEKFLKNRIVIPAYSLNPEFMRVYFEKIIKFNPEYFYGYASALYSFSILMLQKNIKLPFNLKAVVSTAETLHNFQREVIEKAFDCSVVNEYGARDAGILAYECTCGSMHISSENVFLEVVDPKTFEPISYGESGILLVTDLNNFSMPRLRYKLGDKVVLSDQVCKCGIGLPIIEKIDGREDDIFITADGVLVHGHGFNHVARNLAAIKQFQIIQISPVEANLSIITNKDFKQKEIEQFVYEIEQLLPGVKINYKIVKEIPTTSSGKYRYAIRQFPLLKYTNKIH